MLAPCSAETTHMPTTEEQLDRLRHTHTLLVKKEKQL